MKRIISILALLMLMPLCACGQWYLFPLGKGKSPKDTATVMKMKPAAEEKKDTVLIDLNPTVDATDPVEEVRNEEIEDNEDIFVLDIPDVVNISMILPINASEKANANFLAMYTGGLMAARDLGNSGMKIDFNIYDAADPSAPLSSGMMDESDVIIGPVSTDDLQKALSLDDKGKRIISPLEPKAAALTDSCRIIQSPTAWSDQIDDLFKWIDEESVIGDEVIVVRDTVLTGQGEQYNYMISKLEESGIRFKTIYSASSAVPSVIGNTRFLIASDRDAFISASVRQIGAFSIKRKSGDTYLYLTSRMKNAKGIDPQQLYRSNSRVTMSYFIDYSDESVKKFILAYRALYKDEPDSFAFQGYDSVHYFATMCSKYGRQWYKKLPEYSEKGLQSNFKFEERETEGQINRAVRRVVYNQDMSITVQ